MKSRINGVFRQLYEWLAILFFLSLLISRRDLVGFSTIGMFVMAILIHKLDTGKWWDKSFGSVFTTGCFLFFLIQCLAFTYTHNMKSGMKIFSTNLGIIVLPIAVLYSQVINPETWGRLMKWYVGLLFITTAIALGFAGYLFARTGNTSVFFYHPLVKIYSNQAIQFSILVFISIVFLIEESKKLVYFQSRKWVRFLLVYFSIFLFLLTSKLVITVYFIYIIYLILFTEEITKNRHYRFAGLAIIGTALLVFALTNSPLRRRMIEDARTNFSVLKQDTFNPGDYFNGIQFRLMSWRFAFEILNENRRWWLGVSPGDAQDMLNEKYRKLNLYRGESSEKMGGYFIYHTHNQFLQALLETGVFGLAAFLLICTGMVQMAIRLKNRSMIILTALLICYCFLDAVLKTQYGIILFIFFPLFLYKGKENQNSKLQSL